MATISLRFIGRFVFVESAAEPGRLRVLAVDPGRVAEVHSGPHRLYATALRRHVPRRADSRSSSFDAMIPLTVTPDRIQQAVWDLSPISKIVIRGDGFTWDKDAERALLPNLTELGGTSDLKNAASAITTEFEIHGGKASPIAFGKSAEVEYVKFGDPDADSPVIARRALADMLEITFTAGSLELELLSADKKTSGSIVIQTPNPNDAAIVCLSNVCNDHDASVSYDREFAALYEVLETSGPVAERLIPRHSVVAPFNESPCYFSAYVLSGTGAGAEKETVP